ncbi:hypothetical protein CDAR_315711 [Caerostris darwini]|uniref:Secreted protein n=1 Tax=Caerostris darwini TaxID=1538125 RepID=A0AAV4PSR2_9ARAC|nr:hypothetical protein CDAR_315711 [Caerostris darwini]
MRNKRLFLLRTGLVHCYGVGQFGWSECTRLICTSHSLQQLPHFAHCHYASKWGCNEDQTAGQYTFMVSNQISTREMSDHSYCAPVWSIVMAMVILVGRTAHGSFAQATHYSNCPTSPIVIRVQREVAMKIKLLGSTHLWGGNAYSKH